MPGDGEAAAKRYIEATGKPLDVDACRVVLQVPDEAASPLLTNRHQDYRMTRRSMFIGAAAALICAPAIVRATSLMPIRGLPILPTLPALPALPILPTERLNPLGQFYRRCFYHSLERDLRAGRRMTTVIDGKRISVAEGHRMLAYARAQGWLWPVAT
jgi:hypothetical protein